MSFLAKIKNALGVKGSQVDVEPTEPPQPEPLKVVEPPKSPARMTPQSKSALALAGTPQTQADWLQIHIGKIAKSFVQTATRQGWSGPGGEGVYARIDVAALMLGYKMVSLGYQLHNEPPGVEVLRLLRGAINVPLHRAMQAQPKKEDVDRVQEVDEYLKNVNLEVSEVLKTLRIKREGAFAPFFKDLAVAFGGVEPQEQATRYASPLMENFVRLEQAMATQATEQSR